ncbi:hypothetical protein AKJ16_DCAP14544 [Drosera capensis]
MRMDLGHFFAGSIHTCRSIPFPKSNIFTVRQHPQNPFPRPHFTDSHTQTPRSSPSPQRSLVLLSPPPPPSLVSYRLFDLSLSLSSTRCSLESLCLVLCGLVVVWFVGVMMIEVAEETTSFLRSRGAFQRIRTRRVIGLSVLKLDGSRFDVQVSKKATVSDLTIAIEEHRKMDPRFHECECDELRPSLNASRSHVWGHFCLCFNDRKLTNDKALIRQYGITDGDQLHFVRRMTIDYKPHSRQSKDVRTFARSPFVSLPRHTTRKTANRQARADENLTSADNFSHIDDYEEDEGSPFPEFRLRHLFRRWLSYSIRRGATRK